jgi:hypothetical protein
MRLENGNQTVQRITKIPEKRPEFYKPQNSTELNK